MATTPNTNYNDERLTQVETDKQQALTDLEKSYQGMMDSSDKYYQQQIDVAKNYAQQQTAVQNQQTDFAIQKIEQQKAETKQDYLKEQKGAYTEWQKQSSQHGVNAEQMASQGMTNSGYSESSQVAMYNSYQNRVATARESYQRAEQNYNNAITEARLQNSSVLAEIAYNALQTQLELSLQGFQYKNELVLGLAEKKLSIDSEYHSRYMDVLNQLNNERDYAEQVRQFSLEYQQSADQFNKEYQQKASQFAQEIKLKQDEFKESIRQHDEEIQRLREQDKADNAYRIAQLEQQKAELIEEQRQFNLKNGSESLGVLDSGDGSLGSLSTGGSDDLEPDMDSLKALGLGNITAQELYDLVKSGELIEVEKDGKLIYYSGKTGTGLLNAYIASKNKN